MQRVQSFVWGQVLRWLCKIYCLRRVWRQRLFALLNLNLNLYIVVLDQSPTHKIFGRHKELSSVSNERKKIKKLVVREQQKIKEFRKADVRPFKNISNCWLSSQIFQRASFSHIWSNKIKSHLRTISVVKQKNKLDLI